MVYQTMAFYDSFCSWVIFKLSYSRQTQWDAPEWDGESLSDPDAMMSPMTDDEDVS